MVCCSCLAVHQGSSRQSPLRLPPDLETSAYPRCIKRFLVPGAGPGRLTCLLQQEGQAAFSTHLHLGESLVVL